MAINDPNNPIIQLEVMKKRWKSSDEKLYEQRQTLEKLYVSLGEQTSEIRKITKENNELKIELEVTKQKLKHTQEAVLLTGKKSTQKKKTVRLQSFLASLLFLLATILCGFGINLLTSTPPNLLGWIMIALSAIVYVIAAFMTNFVVLEGEQ